MANGKQASVKRLKMADRSQMQMDLHFPHYDKRLLWHRKTNDGFITLPRTLPIAMQAIDMQSKGKPSGHTLFCLWARSPDNSLVIIENQNIFAVEAGFSGERAVDTWRKRMKNLRNLNFIDTKPGSSGEFHYVLLINPNASLEMLYRKGQVQQEIYARFLDRMAEIGAYGEFEVIKELLDTNVSDDINKNNDVTK